ncbi:DUF4114 domain-containing protein [Ancylothrix sp. C2]|uniref:DUF4114 domain-containing protein n=1 Tax=Ancylothrix sp. D3o TaxID=2953691 RepID=UPI0021BB3006|nr:DUF4114 domain-containing protein [Ancylothrix sp. D3o]MCT7950394.1 DUF4114 domain-containing protein [Ancylothrix sp. D3o]
MFTLHGYKKYASCLSGGLLSISLIFSSSQQATAATFSKSWDGEQNSLQNLLNNITLSGPQINTEKAQTNYQTFTNTASGISAGTFMFEVAGMANSNKLGIYNRGNPNQRIQLFDGANSPGAGTTITFLESGINVITQQFNPTTGRPQNSPSPTINYYEGQNWNEFGYYIQTGQGNIFYTQNNLNPGGKQQAVVYRGNNQTQLQLAGRQKGIFTDNEYIIAFEDRLLGDIAGVSSDWDYNDLVVMVESIEPTSVPEPASLVGLTAIAGMLGLTGRRIQNKS